MAKRMPKNEQTPTNIKIQPFARLLTMLGEQLIKNERVALMELIKNSYDADALWVKIKFDNFENNFDKTPKSNLVIMDNGHGITKDIIINHLAHPATPEKKLRKETYPKTDFGRIIQGEKGIGRFSMLKLGRKIKIITRTKNDKIERVIDYDFTMYDDDFLTINGKSEKLFIDNLFIAVTERKPEIFVEDNKKNLESLHGTRIEISFLKGEWSDSKIEKVYNDVARLQSIFSDLLSNKARKPKKDIFDIYIYKDDTSLSYVKSDYQEKLLTLMTDKSVLRVENGFYDEKNKEFRFELNEHKKAISLFDAEITGVKSFKDRFGEGGKSLKDKNTQCGSFQFGFYIFDFRAESMVNAKYYLDPSDKKILKEHRIYLYRDGIRVFPYGEPNDDWLGIDVARGTISASAFLSNNQVVGFVQISQKNNPLLADKTNREGLIEHEGVTDDFITLLQGFLGYLNKQEFKAYKKISSEKDVQNIIKEKKVEKEFEELKQAVRDNKKLTEKVKKAESNYLVEKKYLVQRAETTEELAGVGLSVETASHDIMAIMSRAMMNLDGLIQDVIKINVSKDRLITELQSIRGGLSFVESQIKDIQLLFKSSQQRRKSKRVEEIVEKVEHIYRSLLKKNSIELKIIKTKSPLIAKTTDAVLLQLLINLFDNSIYWLNQIDSKSKIIEIHLNGNDGVMIFSDNGPGIPDDDVEYLFDPFFTGKGQDGRGLGLFIAKQLLEKHDYTIELADLKSDKKLCGANFVVSFVS